MGLFSCRPLACFCLLAALLGATPASAKPKPPVFGGEATQKAAKAWLSSWRNLYVESKDGLVPELRDSELPKAFGKVTPKVVLSAGGAAGGVVTEGMGYAIMVEGIMAAQGDTWALQLGLSLTRAWLGMVQGRSQPAQPLGGSNDCKGSATTMGSWPYGVSAIPGLGPAGVATWKFPLDLCAAKAPWKPCHGSAADGDADAVMGMVYLAGALGYPEDFVDLVMRAVIAFASADLGFPDLYRTLPDGQKVFVPKAGSQWGGLTPPGGKFVVSGPSWCYAPAYFAPAHYRTFRDFAQQNWLPSFDKYLPPFVNGKPTSLQLLAEAFNGAILGGYNILYYSSCWSGTVSNWVGVEAPCASNDTLSCPGVPWANTPYVGKYKGQCSASGTPWGSFGSDASRTPWRLALDYILFTEESETSRIYTRSGELDSSLYFNARVYLNRIATQYKRYAKCDGGIPGDCDCHYPGCAQNVTQPIKLSAAFEVVNWPRTPGLTCDNVPHHGKAWWAGFMSYPTFTAFIAPYVTKVDLGPNKTLEPMSPDESRNWLDAFVNICDFNNFTEEGGWLIQGRVCQKTYFHVSQEAISTMIMAGNVKPLPPKKVFIPAATTASTPTAATAVAAAPAAGATVGGASVVWSLDGSSSPAMGVVKKTEATGRVASAPLGGLPASVPIAALAALAPLGLVGAVMALRRRGRQEAENQRVMRIELGPLMADGDAGSKA